MNPIFRCHARVLTAAVLFAGFAFAQSIDLTTAPGSAALDGVWRWRNGFEAEWADSRYDDTSWENLAVPGKLPEGQGGEFSIRIHLRCRARTDAALLAGRVGHAYTVFWDGKSIGQFGETPPDTRSFEPRWMVFALPETVTAGDHVVAFRVHRAVALAESRPVVLAAGETRFGSLADLNSFAGDYIGDDFRSVLPQVLTAFGLFLAGIYFGFLPQALRGGMALQWMGTFLLARAVLLGIGLWNGFGPMEVPLEWEILPAALLFRIHLVALAAFVFTLTGQRMTWYIRALFGVVLLSAILEIPQLGVRMHQGAGVVVLGLFAMTPLWLAVWQLWNRRKSTVEARALVWFVVAWTVAASWTLLVEAHAPGTYIPAGPFRMWTTDAIALLMIPAILTLLIRRTEVQQTERKQLLDEMEAAREVQEMLVPATRARTPGYRIQSAYKPMAEVGGDFFQWFETSDHGVLLVAGDVSGKGLRAAMMVSMIVGLLQQRRSEQPSEVLRELNHGLAGRVSGGFVTCCAARFTPEGLARIANAGHIPPYKNGSDLKLESGIPLGMMPEAEWEETAIQLLQNDRLVFLSDGVVEARSAGGELLGFDRARDLSYRPASEIARFAEKWGQEDDITVIAITHDRAAEHSA